MADLCGNCGAEASHLHHIVPRSLGGSNSKSNLVNLCTDCHGKIHSKDFTTMKALQLEGIKRAKEAGKYKVQVRKKTVDRLQVCYLNTQGYSSYKIAEVMGICRMTVYRILNKEGLKNVKVRLKE